ncbi:tRNA1(Val) (adenine(37)-N6)-methyltransferase [Mesorhizobium sp. J428]|uniref:tRNA1(Val) (adenine(37)-N6)-methyltransferase n=1 Tax=Mesorhizobium sp. J428 TaxID=2898440 RepID=UPI0021514BE8|nr:methyltransferase [Mesorhizobium sp. J428]MCR5858686.1 methyltransferase [Mesorhizobium sp. J428]
MTPPLLPAGHTLDAFHRGAFHLVQPRDGHRAGMDALVLAAAVPGGFAGGLADLGAGAGAAALAVLSRCPGARATLVEREPAMLEAAQLTLALAENAVLSGRAKILAVDVELAGKARAAAGLADNSFDAAIMNPPFNAPRDRATPDGLRRSAHVMQAGTIEAWVRTAAAIVKPRGMVAIIARPVSLPQILSAFEGRLGGAEIVPVHPRPEEPAIRIVVRGKRGSRAALTLLPPLVLHAAQGNALSARADAIVNGQASLFGD